MIKSNSNKKLRRIIKIHQLLRTGQSFSAQKMVEKLIKFDNEINERTIRNDIAFLRELGADIKGHRFSGFSYNKPFTLITALDGIDSANYEELINFVRQGIKRKSSDKNLVSMLIALEKEMRASGAEQNPYIDFEKVEQKNVDKLEKLYGFIIHKKVIEIEYLPFNNEIENRTILPLLLKEYNNRWSLIGFDKYLQRIQNFPLDRIENEKLSSQNIHQENPFDSLNYFKEIIGTSIESEKLETVVYRVQKKRAFYVRTKKWHSTQEEIAEDEKSITFTISIKPNREFWAKVMEHVEDIKIIDPKPIVDDFKEKIRKVYEKVINGGINNI